MLWAALRLQRRIGIEMLRNVLFCRTPRQRITLPLVLGRLLSLQKRHKHDHTRQTNKEQQQVNTPPVFGWFIVWHFFWSFFFFITLYFFFLRVSFICFPSSFSPFVIIRSHSGSRSSISVIVNEGDKAIGFRATAVAAQDLCAVADNDEGTDTGRGR